jgi:hypothetical protein
VFAFRRRLAEADGFKNCLQFQNQFTLPMVLLPNLLPVRSRR